MATTLLRPVERRELDRAWRCRGDDRLDSGVVDRRDRGVLFVRGRWRALRLRWAGSRLTMDRIHSMHLLLDVQSCVAWVRVRQFRQWPWAWATC